MIRFILTPVDTDLTITIPEKYVGKQIEIIAFATDEVEEFALVREAYTKGIDEAILHLEKGNFVPHEDIEKDMERGV
jgi:putative transposon-encoded protein